MKSQAHMLLVYMEHILRFLSRLKVNLTRAEPHTCAHFKVVVGKLWRQIRGQKNTMSISKFYLHCMACTTGKKVCTEQAKLTAESCFALVGPHQHCAYSATA